jgi:hypothetical protein
MKTRLACFPQLWRAHWSSATVCVYICMHIHVYVPASKLEHLAMFLLSLRRFRPQRRACGRSRAQSRLSRATRPLERPAGPRTGCLECTRTLAMHTRCSGLERDRLPASWPPKAMAPHMGILGRTQEVHHETWPVRWLRCRAMQLDVSAAALCCDKCPVFRPVSCQRVLWLLTC